MNIIYGIDQAEIRRPTTLTLGVFDGLHLGHQAIVRTVVERASLVGATPTLITFDPHPRQVLKPETAPPLLQTAPATSAAGRQRMSCPHTGAVTAAAFLETALSPLTHWAAGRTPPT